MAEFTKEGISDADGKIYGLPLYLEGYQFCYNVKLFEKAGITELPRTDGSRLSGTQLEDAGIPAIINSLSGLVQHGRVRRECCRCSSAGRQGQYRKQENGTMKFETKRGLQRVGRSCRSHVRHTYKE